MRPSNNNRGKSSSDIETTDGSTSDWFVKEQLQFVTIEFFLKFARLELLAFSYCLNMRII